MRVFLIETSEGILCLNVDNDADASALAADGGRELTEAEIEAAFGDQGHMAGGPGTVVTGDTLATATVTWTAPEEDPLARVAEIEAELSALDAAAVRPLRAVLTATQAETDPADDDVNQLAALEAQAVALRAERAALVVD